MSALTALLQKLRDASMTEREKGTYFEELIRSYLRHEATYRDLYQNVWTYADWAEEQKLDRRDTGIDLVAQMQGTGEFHAIQCKFYAPDARIQKSDIDSFFTASGKRPFTHRVIVSTTDHWSEHALDALRDQQPPVSKIDLTDLENSQIDWSRYEAGQPVALKQKKSLRPHQQLALERVQRGLAVMERGKLIMACGTGKTFTSLKIAERLAGAGRRVLFLVPSLSLLSQTLTEWTQESDLPLHSFAVCSDSEVGRKRKADDDAVQTFAHELRYPATTNPMRLAREMEQRHDADHMSVVFSTYHSIDVVSQAQQSFGLADFDLIVCDEAHRTTGATFDGEDESTFVRVHDAAYIRSAKRLYMTATPRIYGDTAKATAEKDNVALCSMDDEALFGRELHVITFSEAVKQGLLVDYKVIVLAMDERHVSASLQNLLKDSENQIKVEDAAKIVGCWKALSKQDTQEALSDDAAPMRRAVAFCQVIEMQHKGRTHKVSSKKIAAMFQRVVEEYKASNPEEEGAALSLRCEASHVDGGMSASEKEARLNWLKEETPADTCRILSNVRCLSEGVDVPALDAVLFLTPRNSQIDVVQSVGRVMRRAPGKTRGYVVLPVVIPAGIAPDEALNDNRTYKVVWQVLQALRSHDDRFDAHINKLDLNGPDPSRMEVIAVTDGVQKRKKADSAANTPGGRGSYSLGSAAALQQKGSGDVVQGNAQGEFLFEIGEVERAIYAKLVEKCGNRHHWEDWATDIARIARTHITRISTILENPANGVERAAFTAFAKELRDDLNDSISDAEVIEMLAQHLITRPVFEALFADYSFASHNPISRAMQATLDALQEHRLENEADTLQRFYDSVRMRASGIDRAEGKQKIIVELYDKFFRNAFPRMTERLGIVYTPTEVVDFIIRSVNDLLQQEFGQTLGSPDVHIMDPFTGTGTFITRLMQSGLISPDELRQKYRTHIHANEIVLLAYYIAAINIEAVYHSIVGDAYEPFPGICLTDTFQLYEKDDLVSALLVDNSHRRTRQKALDIRVILGNPPYSVGQDKANDNNANVEYPHLDGRIRSTYAARSNANNKNALYDSYIRAIRWASDRIGNSGIIGFVTNAGFIDANTADGLRRCLSEEFSSLYIFHLRGNQRTSGEVSRREGGKIFGSGSRAPIAISLLVKNPAAAEQGKIHFHDIGDYLSREEKLERITGFASISGITTAGSWRLLETDSHGDWLKQRDDSFSVFIPIGDKSDKSDINLFENYTNGIKTNADAWFFNSNKEILRNNMIKFIDTYNKEVNKYLLSDKKIDFENFADMDYTKIKWHSGIIPKAISGKYGKFNEEKITNSIYRPFFNQYIYNDSMFVQRVGQIPRIFPDDGSENLIIIVKQRWSGEGHLALMSDRIVELQTDGGTQCFPLYLYEPAEAEKPEATGSDDLFATPGGGATAVAGGGYHRRDGISDAGLAHFRVAYPGEALTKEDIFYYVYGLLHSPDYRSRFADNLAKELPRIPCVKQAADFWAFSQAGRDLAALHLNYETVAPHPATITGEAPGVSYRVEKMRYGGKGGKDRSILHYNAHITVSGIPLEAYEYVVNGKPALDWVVERQGVRTDKASGIVNDANDWAVETMNNPRYPLDLFLRVITVSLETNRIVANLPPLDI